MKSFKQYLKEQLFPSFPGYQEIEPVHPWDSGGQWPDRRPSWENGKPVFPEKPLMRPIQPRLRPDWDPNNSPEGAPPGPPNPLDHGQLHEYPVGSGQYWEWDNETETWSGPQDLPPDVPAGGDGPARYVPSPVRVVPYTPWGIPGYFPQEFWDKFNE